MYWLIKISGRCALVSLTLLLLLSLSTKVLASKLKIEVYETYNPAPTLVSQIQPLLSDTDHITVFRGKLIIKALPHTHQSVIELLNIIDTLPKSLLIQIREKDDGGISSRSSNTTIQYDKTPKGSSVTVQAQGNSRQITTQRPIRQSLRITEGEEGYIFSGEEEKETRWQFVNGYFVPRDEIKQSGSGFYIRPNVIKNHVRLSVSHESFKRPNQKTQAQNQTHTDVLIPINTWTQLSSSNINEATTKSNTFSSHKKNNQNLEIKIEILE